MEEVSDVLGYSRATVVIGALCALLAYADDVQAQISIRVRGESHIDLEVADEPTGLWAHARLVDESGKPLPSRELRVRVTAVPDAPAVERVLLSDERGTCSLEISQLAASGSRVSASFAGDDWYEASHAEAALDRRVPVALSFVTPATELVDLARPVHELVVRARSRAGAGALPIMLRNETGRELATGTTDASGMLRIAVASAALGNAGKGELVAESAADASRAAGRVAIDIVRFEPTRLELRLAEPAHSPTGIALRGRLTARDVGVPDAAVGLFEGARHVATVLTNERGEYAYVVPPEAAAVESMEGGPRLHARYQSNASWRGSSRSATVELARAPAKRLRFIGLFAPPLACAVLLAWLRRRASSMRGLAPKPRARANDAGVSLAASRSRFGRGTHSVLSGAVLDVETERGLAHARVTLMPGSHAQQEVLTDVGGSFSLRAAGVGSCRLRVEAQGYRAFEQALQLPHRGEWLGVSIRLESLRAAAVRACGEPALRIEPSLEHWAAHSPREILARVAEKLANDRASIAQTLADVESAAYGRAEPTEERLAQIERDAATLAARLDHGAGRQSR